MVWKGVNYLHIPTFDGVGCAILLKNFYKNIDIEYCNYDDVNEKVENFLHEDYINYDKVFITDISVNEKVAEIIDELICIKEFVLLDHHKTADWLNKYEWAKVEENDRALNRKTSGTMMLHRYLYDNKLKVLTGNILEFTFLVNDYDTWHWNKIGDINPKKLNDLYYIYGRDTFIDKVLTYFISDKIDIFTSTDNTLLELKQKDIDYYVEKKNKLIIRNKLFGYNMGVVFCENYISEVGNKLCSLNPDIDFMALINMDYSISYRTIKDNVDVSEIAKKLGGGGHRSSGGSPLQNSAKLNVIEYLFGKTEEMIV